jgi:hypothetical protein
MGVFGEQGDRFILGFSIGEGDVLILCKFAKSGLKSGDIGSSFCSTMPGLSSISWSGWSMYFEMDKFASFAFFRGRVSTVSDMGGEKLLFGSGFG